MNSHQRRKQKRAVAKKVKDALVKELMAKGLSGAQLQDALNASLGN